jgi:hypothetical protein
MIRSTDKALKLGLMEHKYVGEWMNGKNHGQGTYTLADGTIEKGLWVNDEFVGE